MRIATALPCLACLASLAVADYPPRDPGYLHEKGREAFDRGLYAQALEWFIEISETTNSIPCLYNLALTHYKMENYSLARTFYRRYLKRAIAAGLLPESPKRWPPHVFVFGERLVEQLRGYPDEPWPSTVSVGARTLDNGGLWWPIRGLR